MATIDIRDQAGSSASTRNARRRGGWTTRTLVTAFMLLVLVYFVIPLVWLLISATKTNADLFDSFGFWFASDFNLFNNLHDTFTRDGGIFLTWLWNSTYYAVVSSIGATLVATMAGYVFAKFRFPGNRVLFAMILGAIMVPNTALVVPLYLLLSKVGLVNTPWAIILPSLVTPFGLYLIRVYAEQAISDDLLDAGRVDGASEWRLFWQVALRLMGPGVVTVLLLTFVGTWNNFFLPQLLLSDPNLYPLTVGLSVWNGQAQSFSGSQLLFTLVLTGSVISIIPLILGFLFLQRFWQSGLTFGSLKG